MLNRTANFSTSMLADYISYNWTQRSGRYLMLNLSYKFDKTGKLKKRLASGNRRNGKNKNLLNFFKNNRKFRTFAAYYYGLLQSIHTL